LIFYFISLGWFMQHSQLFSGEVFAEIGDKVDKAMTRHLLLSEHMPDLNVEREEACEKNEITLYHPHNCLERNKKYGQLTFKSYPFGRPY
jgi:hypothetical protein